jgi:hypothetical protein
MAHAIGRTAGWKGTLRLALLAGLCLPLTGCTEDQMGLDILGYNHTDRSIYSFGRQ